MVGRHPFFWGVVLGAGGFYLATHFGGVPAIGGGKVKKTAGS